MKQFAALLPALLFFLNSIAQDPYYHIKVDPDRKVKVTARFPLFNDTIFIFMRGTTAQLPDGEAGFVKNLLVKDENGTNIPNRYAGEGNWILKGVKSGQPITLEYDLLTTHTEFNWDHVGGSDEAAFSNQDGLFFTGYTLFMVPGMDLKNIIVEFSLPAGWKASTPWEKLKITGSKRKVAVTC